MRTRINKLAALLLPLGLLAFANTASAGDYHTGATLRCADCHVMHFSQSHGYNANGGGFFTPLGGTEPHHYLLRDEINNLCLSCHDGSSFAPDVLGVNEGNLDIRQAGHLNRVGGSAFVTTGHTLDSLDVAPGSDPPWKAEDVNGAGHGLNCVNCHHQHGYAGFGSVTGTNYRNLLSNPGNGSGAFVTYNNGAPGVNDLLMDVYQRAEVMYDESDVDFNEPDTTQSSMGQYCAGCHTNFHGTPGDATTVGGVPNGTSFSEFVRHPSAGVDIGDIGGGHSSLGVYQGHTNKVKVMSATGDWTGTGADVTPTCISCHKAHGNDNSFGLIFRSGTGTLSEEGDSDGIALEDLCGQCHVQG